MTRQVEALVEDRQIDDDGGVFNHCHLEARGAFIQWFQWFCLFACLLLHGLGSVFNTLKFARSNKNRSPKVIFLTLV